MRRRRRRTVALLGRNPNHRPIRSSEYLARSVEYCWHSKPEPIEGSCADRTASPAMASALARS